MKITGTTYTLFIIILLSSCRAYKIENHYSDEVLSNKLPKMNIYYDNDIISAAMADHCLKSCGDILYDICNHELNNNIFGSTSSEYTFRISIQEHDFRSNLAFLPIVAITLGLNTILGIPARVDHSEITIRCHILDENLNPVYVVEETGYGKAPVVAYYGYGNSKAIPESKAQAVADAFKKIKNRIENDTTLKL